MASADERDALRRATALDPTDTTYTDAVLDLYIDSTGSVAAAASQIWREKAAGYVGMVDTTESGSSRKLSQLADQALAAAAGFTSVDEAARGARSYTTPIERV